VMTRLTPIERMTGAKEARQTLRIAARRVSDHALTLAQRMTPGLTIDTSTPVGDAREVLLDLSDQAAIIVVGNRGHGPATSLLLGSVSVAVAAQARCAVAVVRPEKATTSGIVVGVSADGSDRAALDFAAELASAEGSALDAVHAWQTRDAVVDRVSSTRRLENMDLHERAFAEALAGMEEKYPDVQVNRHLPDAGPVGGLVEKSRSASCVVVGSRGRTGTVAMLGSVSRSVIEHAHCTVVVVRG